MEKATVTLVEGDFVTIETAKGEVLDYLLPGFDFTEGEKVIITKEGIEPEASNTSHDGKTE